MLELVHCIDVQSVVNCGWLFLKLRAQGILV